MPTKKRTPSRGRPPGRRSESLGRRAPSAARRDTAQQKQPQQQRQLRTREAKSPTKKKVTTPSGGAMPTRKVSTAPATQRSRSPARGRTKLTKTSASFIDRSVPNSHGIARTSAASVTVSSSSASFTRSMSGAVPSPSPSPVGGGRPSPPQLRSRTITKHIEQLQQQLQQQKQSPKAKGATEGWRVMDKVKATPGAIGRQMDKLGKLLRGGPRPLLKRTGAHLRRNWHFWLSLIVLLLLGLFLIKFQREVLINVQQMRKQLVDFVNEQYVQKRQIFGEQWQRAMETMEWARQKYLIQPQIPQATSFPQGAQSALPSDRK